MSADNGLFTVDTILDDGKPIAFESGSATLSGAAGFERQVVPSADGPDFSRRVRVARQLRLNLQFGPTTDPAALAKKSGVQVALRDKHSGRRALCNNCEFASMGEIGGGPVQLTYNILEPIQWL